MPCCSYRYSYELRCATLRLPALGRAEQQNHQADPNKKPNRTRSGREDAGRERGWGGGAGTPFSSVLFPSTSVLFFVYCVESASAVGPTDAAAESAPVLAVSPCCSSGATVAEGAGDSSGARLSVVVGADFPADDRGFRDDGLYWSSPVKMAPSWTDRRWYVVLPPTLAVALSVSRW